MVREVELEPTLGFYALLPITSLSERKEGGVSITTQHEWVTFLKPLNIYPPSGQEQEKKWKLLIISPI